MNLQLLITETKTKHLFAVIDLDKSKKYPQNFVSLLPKKIKATKKPTNVFEGLFGNESIKIAKQLLEKALRKRPNPETTVIIRERLKLLDSEINNRTKCQSCGTTINQSKSRFRKYKFCYKCHTRNHVKQ